MSAVKPIPNSLKWETFITHRGSLSRDAPAGKEHLKWVPNTVTLISGEKDAVLVECFSPSTPPSSWPIGSWPVGKT
jgi:hypothetical protein